jgi:RsbRD-like negative regulator of sigma factor
MTTPESSTPNQDNIGARLATFLADRRDKIIKEWTAFLKRDHKVESAKMVSPSELKDHLPRLLDQLAETLADVAKRDIHEKAAWTAASHGDIRWKQQFDVSEVLREFAHLREVLIYHFVEFQRRNPEFSGVLCLLEMIVLHRYLDETTRISVEQYLAANARSKR